MNQIRSARISQLRIVFVLLPLLILVGCSTTPTSANAVSQSRGNTTTNTWRVSQNARILQIAYGSGTNFPQYAALDLSSSYFRMVYSTTSQWGTSVILLPTLWSKASCPTDYCQGAPVTATWQKVGSNLTLSIQGTIATPAGCLHSHTHPSCEQRLCCSSFNDGHRDGQVRQSPSRSLQTGDALLNAHLIDPMGFTSGFHWNPDLQLPIERLDHSAPDNRSRLRFARWNEYLENERSHHRGELEPGQAGNGVGHTEQRSE